MGKAKEVVQTQDQLPAMAMDFQGDAGAGYEEADKDSYAIPFISILQALSPQVDESEGAYIEGAKSGMFMNTVTADVYNGVEGLELIPVHYSRAYTEWGLRENGGGFKGEHSVDEGVKLLQTATRDDKNREIIENGNQLVDTRSHFILVKTPTGWHPVILALTSTQLKKSRKWMTAMNQLQVDGGNGHMFTPPMFANRYKMTTVKETNDQGSWYGFKFERLGFVEDAVVYNLAKEFRERIKAGEARAAHESTNPEGGASGDFVPPAPDDGGDDPFDM